MEAYKQEIEDVLRRIEERLNRPGPQPFVPVEREPGPINPYAKYPPAWQRILAPEVLDFNPKLSFQGVLEAIEEMRTQKVQLAKRHLIYLRDSGYCWLCDQPVDFYARGDFKPSMDHIKPRSHGGSNDLLNLRLAHGICNTKRDTLDAAEARELIANWTPPRLPEPLEPSTALRVSIGAILQSKAA